MAINALNKVFLPKLKMHHCLSVGRGGGAPLLWNGPSIVQGYRLPAISNRWRHFPWTPYIEYVYFFFLVGNIFEA